MLLESFYSAVRVVVPMGILMLLGFSMRKLNIIDRPAMKKFDGIIYRIFMPTLLFKNIYEIDFSRVISYKEFIFAVVRFSPLRKTFFIIPPKISSDKSKAASLAQAVIRGNYILFGVAVAEALYGEGNIGAVILLGSFTIPAINILSAVAIEIHKSGRAGPVKLVKAVLKNPMVIATIFAFTFVILKIKIPAPIWGVMKNLSSSTTTLSFISLGVGLEMTGTEDFRPLICGLILRMIFVPVIFMTLSILFGFRGQVLCAFMVLFAAPVAVASYPMAVAMGADGKLAGQLVCISTLLSIFTIFLWTFGLSSFGML